MTKAGTFLQTTSEKYSEETSFRALIQVIPVVGGSLDTLMAGQGTTIQKQRIESFLRDLERRMTLVESAPAVQPTEELFDLMMNAFDSVVRTRSEKKRKRFASLVANQVSMRKDWEDVDTALRLVDELTDLHIEILTIARNAPISDATRFQGLKIISLFDEYDNFKDGGERDMGYECGAVSYRNEPPNLVKYLPKYSYNVLRMACSELVSHSLLYDVGIGLSYEKPLTYLQPSNLTEWLFSWISEEGQT